ncbi:MAG TPA: ABC transporter permease [Candidatus Polarisedimenticolaceae bacterium]|nr:ABC transporter permease [Candidatus Polarisedimenticolaceae bacterium]
MSPGEIGRTALAEIRGHKLRSTLTLLGIILGTLSITVMTSFLDGIVISVWQGFDDLGFDGVMYVVNRDARDLREQSLFARSRGLQPEDAELLMVRRRWVSEVAPVVIDEQLVREGAVERRARVIGVTPGYASVRSRTLSAGRFIADADERAFARVCVIGYRMKLRFFGADDALGRSVSVGGRPFQVVGVGRKLGNQFVNDDDFIEEMEGLYVPLSTLRKFYTGEQSPLSFIAVKTREAERLAQLEAEVESSLRIAHRGVDDFRVQNVAEEILRARAEVTEQLRNWKIVLGTIAGISLLVGGIGLLSVMLISIGERMYEIGLRKALGATDTEVFTQFLLEAVVLATIGGVLGTAGGVAIIQLVAGFFPAGLPIRFGGLALALGIAVALGASYGAYPALKASRMPPVDALRSAA